jgi:predicted O-methyltransferase YrrM
MTPETWTAVDRYVVDSLFPPDAALDAALRASERAALPAIAVSPALGRFLHLLARIRGARRILEIGALGGYSTIWLARALPPDGRLVSLEYDPRHAEVARGSVAAAGLADRVEVRVGPALDLLPRLEGGEPFDFVFIDADKPPTADYFRWAVTLSRPGTVIVVDNVVRDGQVIDPKGDEGVQGMRRFIDAAGADRRVEATVIQTVGAKGYDGFAIALVS